MFDMPRLYMSACSNSLESFCPTIVKFELKTIPYFQHRKISTGRN